MFVNRLNSAQTVIPFEYHKLDFCQASSDEPSSVENLGQIVFGDRFEPSPYKMSFNKNVTKVVCRKLYKKDSYTDQQHIAQLKSVIALNYQHNWVIDNMPVSWCYLSDSYGVFCLPRFPVGCYVDQNGIGKDGCQVLIQGAECDRHYVYNHFDIVIEYEPVGEMGLPEGAGRLVKARLNPRSVQHVEGMESVKESLKTDKPQVISLGDLSIQYSYSVYFVLNPNVKWASRWDYILDSVISNSNVVIFSILNSSIILLFLTAVLAVALWKALHNEIPQHDVMNLSDKILKDFGWMFIHGDVFRPPANGLLLSVFLASGVQLVITAVIILFFASLGYLSPVHRGALMTSTLVLYTCLGMPAGYVSARIYKMFGGKKCKLHFLITSLLCPGIIFTVFFVLNIIYWKLNSSAVVPVTTVFTLLGLWLVVSLPLTLVGCFFGHKKSVMEHPVRINPIPRQIPAQKIYANSMLGTVIGGILPFGCIFIQLYFILNSLWSHQIYSMFTFLFIAGIVFILTCSMSTIMICYIHLRTQDYRWWWRSFLSSGFTGGFFFLYSIQYFLTKLDISDSLSAFFYFGYSAMIAFLIFLLSGTLGFLACFWFITKIYSGKPLQSFVAMNSGEPFLISSKVEFAKKIVPQLASFDLQNEHLLAPPAYCDVIDVPTVEPPAYCDEPTAST